MGGDLALMRVAPVLSFGEPDGANSKKPESPKLYENSSWFSVSTLMRHAVDAPAMLAAASVALTRALRAADGHGSSRAASRAALLLLASCLA